MTLCAQERLYGEFYISLASLLRSYCVAHGMGRSQQAEIEVDGFKILARYQDRWLQLQRVGSEVSWQREDGRSGRYEWTEAGQLRSETSENEMDLVAEEWARELMQ